MNFLFIALIIVFGISLLITILSIGIKTTAMDIVNNMGMGWNLANTFDCYSDYKEIKTPDEQITLWGNNVPTKELFIKLKKYGFKAIRFPVTWFHFMDEVGNINLSGCIVLKRLLIGLLKKKCIVY